MRPCRELARRRRWAGGCSGFGPGTPPRPRPSAGWAKPSTTHRAAPTPRSSSPFCCLLEEIMSSLDMNASATAGADLKRRRFLVGAGAAAAAGLGARSFHAFDESAQRAEVFIAKAESYDADLEGPILRRAVGPGLRSLASCGQVGVAQAEPRGADTRGAAGQHASRADPGGGGGVSGLAGARGLRRRGTGALPRRRAGS